MSFLKKILKGFLGDKNQTDLKNLWKYVDQINHFQKEFTLLSPDELSLKTVEFKSRIRNSTEQLSEKSKELELKAKLTQDLKSKESIYNEIDKIKNEIYLLEQKSLSDLLPEAFALIKETARRFKENKELRLKANEFSRELSLKRSYVEIQENDTVVWKNSWDAFGKPIIWDMIHYDVQLIGGIVLHQGKIAEMATGEGKTLTSTLSIYLNALPGRGVHVVTVNDYLAKRDSAWMAPIMEFHGLSVDCIDLYPPNTPSRKKAYRADVTYGTNNEFGFDYLRDNMAQSQEELVQREFNYAIVDEIDSVLIDDARTPLIISGPVPKSDLHEFDFLKPKVESIVERQKKFLVESFNEAKKLFEQGDKKKSGEKLFEVYRGLPKYKPLIKFLSQENVRVTLQKAENYYMQDNNKEMPKVDAHLYFVIDEKNHTVELTDKGIEFLSGEVNDSNFFILPDLSTEVFELEKKNLSKEEELSQKEKLIKDFSIKSDRLHSISQLLKAYCLFEKDIEYVVMNSQVKIVDEQTGRIMEGRRYSDGLHQALEAKENVKIEDSSQTFATITLQNYFRMYRKLSGMTGTAETEAEEFWKIYKLDIVVIPTNKPMIRKDLNDLIYKTKREKYNAVLDQIVELSREKNRPVLVGTTSVEISEILSRSLRLRKIPHNVLNAKLHKKEADIIAAAGIPGVVTIATNMAGRGTDIKPTEEVVKAGGLAIIGVERHDSRRVDRQLRGRSARQGDPGTSQFYVSLEDNLMRLFAGSQRLARLMDRFGHKEGDVIEHSLMSKSIQRAQKKVEENNFGIRKHLLEYDDVMNRQREIIYKIRRNALLGERVSLEVASMIYKVQESLVSLAKSKGDFKNLEYELLKIFSIDRVPFEREEFDSSSSATLSQKLYGYLIEFYEKKQEELSLRIFNSLAEIYGKSSSEFKNIQLPFTDGEHPIFLFCNLREINQTRGKSLISNLEKSIILSIIDERWKEHLRQMDYLRQSVQTAVYEQKDPLLIYKAQAFSLFGQTISTLYREIVSFLFKSKLPEIQANFETSKIGLPRKKEEKLQLGRGQDNFDENNLDANSREINFTPRKIEKTPGRNEKVQIRHLQTGEKKELKYKEAEKLIERGEWEIEQN